jgi:hypothetical protein
MPPGKIPPLTFIIGKNGLPETDKNVWFQFPAYKRFPERFRNQKVRIHFDIAFFIHYGIDDILFS